MNQYTMNQPVGYQYYPQPQVTLPQRPSLVGRTIRSHDEVTPGEVPMDSVAYFPTSDGKVIFAKAWNRDGGITTVRYVQDVETDTVSTPTIADVMAQLDNIQTLLNELPSKPPAKRTTKKEAADE